MIFIVVGVVTLFKDLTTKLSLICRKTLGFWAGHRNSKIRVILARVWENDTELDISNNRINRATAQPLAYQKRFYKTKFCICPGGSQVNSARIADSIHYGCVPGELLISLIVSVYDFFFFLLLAALWKMWLMKPYTLVKTYGILSFPFLMSPNVN